MKSIYRTGKGKSEIQTFYEKQLRDVPYLNRRTVQTSFGTTSILEAEADKGLPALLLLHGSGSNSLSWLGEIGKLSSTHRVFSIDIPGEPGLSDEQRFSSKGPLFSRWLDEVISALALEIPIIAGLSLGGWAAVRYAIDHPSRIERAIALAPTGIVQPRPGFLWKTIMTSLRGENGIRDLLSLMLDGEDVPEEVVQFQLLLMKHFRFRSDAPPLFTDDEIRTFPTPLTFVFGRNDYVFDAEKAHKRITHLNPEIGVHLLEKGHALTDLSPFLNDNIR